MVDVFAQKVTLHPFHLLQLVSEDMFPAAKRYIDRYKLNMHITNILYPDHVNKIKCITFNIYYVYIFVLILYSILILIILPITVYFQIPKFAAK